MAHGSRTCPACGALNALDERVCVRCHKRLPGPWSAALVDGARALLGREFPLTMLFIGMNLAVFLGAMIDSGGFRDLRQNFPLSALLRWGAITGPLWGVADRFTSFVEPFRYVSAMFLHLGLLHIVFNMTFLFDFGRATEQRLGSGRFALIYFVSGVGGYLASDAWWLIDGAPGVTAGASGALFGLAGATVVNLIARRDPAYKDLLLHLGVFTLVMFIAKFPVNHAAHFGGMLCGAGLGYVFHRERQPHRRDAAFGWVAAAIVVVSAASILLCQLSPLWQKQRRLELLVGALDPATAAFPML